MLRFWLHKNEKKSFQRSARIPNSEAGFLSLAVHQSTHPILLTFPNHNQLHNTITML